MKIIDPSTENIHCPHCSSGDVRYLRSEEHWTCKVCGQDFTAEGWSDGIRIKELECREGEEGQRWS